MAFGSAPADPVPSVVTLDAAGQFMVDGTLQGIETLAREKEPDEAAAPPAPVKAAPRPKRVKKKAPKADAEPSLKAE